MERGIGRRRKRRKGEGSGTGRAAAGPPPRGLAPELLVAGARPTREVFRASEPPALAPGPVRVGQDADRQEQDEEHHAGPEQHRHRRTSSASSTLFCQLAG